METMKEPVAIITSGGGMKCAYSAGALTALAGELKTPAPDLFIAASGSVGTMFYYLANQYEEIRRVWTKFLPSKHFITYGPIPSMNINYLIDTIAKDYVPLDVDRLNASTTRYFVPVTDERTGDTRFINREHWLSPYEVTRAATAIPLLYRGHVRLGNHSYLDGDFSTGTATLIKKALDEGARRILLITNSDSPTRVGKAVLRLYGAILKPGLRAALLKDLESDQSIVWPDDLKFVCVSPTYPLPTMLYSRERRKVVESFTMGEEDILARREEIEALFRP